MGGGEPISWYEYAQDDFRTGRCLACPCTPPTNTSIGLRRGVPNSRLLSNSKLEAAGIAPMPPLREAISEYLKPREHATAPSFFVA